jgi:hypothetical protein
MRSPYYQTLLIFILIFPALSCGNRNTVVKQERAHISVTEKMQSKGIVFVGEMHNFGTLKAGEIISFSFIFTNSGSLPFRIKKAEVSCGCLSVKYDEKEIAPGEKSAIEVILNTSGEWGNLLKMVELETSSGEKKELKIGAYVENEKFNNLLNTQK